MRFEPRWVFQQSRLTFDARLLVTSSLSYMNTRHPKCFFYPVFLHIVSMSFTGYRDKTEFLDLFAYHCTINYFKTSKMSVNNKQILNDFFISSGLTVPAVKWHSTSFIFQFATHNCPALISTSYEWGPCMTWLEGMLLACYSDQTTLRPASSPYLRSYFLEQLFPGKSRWR